MVEANQEDQTSTDGAVTFTEQSLTHSSVDFLRYELDELARYPIIDIYDLEAEGEAILKRRKP